MVEYEEMEEHYRQQASSLSPYIKQYLIGHYHWLPRKELAKRVGMDKFDLNMILIQLGLGR